MANFISFVHLICFLLLIFGFIFSPPVTMIHVIAIPAVIIHWWMNNNQCILTQLQKKFEIEDPDKKDLEGNFTREVLLKLGISLSDKQLKILIYVVMAVSWSLSLRKIL